MQYRFRTLGARGRVVLCETEVECETSSHLGRWKTRTPYSAISPHSIETWHTDTVCLYMCAVIALFAVASAIIAFSTPEGWDWTSPDPIACLLSIGCLVALVYFTRKIKVEWLVFPTSIDGHRIAYPRSNTTFDDFTTELRSKIGDNPTTRTS